MQSHDPSLRKGNDDFNTTFWKVPKLSSICVLSHVHPLPFAREEDNHVTSLKDKRNKKNNA